MAQAKGYVLHFLEDSKSFTASGVCILYAFKGTLSQSDLGSDGCKCCR